MRWSQQQGSVYLLDEKLPITDTRVRNLPRNVEIPVATYERVRAADTGLFRKVLRGLNCCDYARCAEAVPEAFGLSASSVFRRFIRASARSLRTRCKRRLDQEHVVAVVLDGKTL